MVRKKDRFWEYVEDLKGRFKCNFCKREFAGGATRIKCHLAGVKCHDIDICTEVSKEVQEEASLIIGEPNKKLKGASTSNRDKKKEINSTSIPTDVTLGRVFEKSKEEYSTEIDLSVAVEGLLAKVRSLLIDHIGSGLGYKEQLIELLVSLSKIQVVLQDTEKWQITDELMRIRLAEFRDVVYDVDDVLDEFEIRKQEVQSQNQIMESIGISLFNPITSPFNIEIKMKNIIDRLLDTIKNGLRVGSMDTIPKISLDSGVDSYLNDLEIVGRGCDVSKIVNMLTNASNQRISILPIMEEWKDAKELASAGEVSVFPCLEVLTLSGCPKLRYLPDSLNTCVSLQKLVVGCGDLRYLPGVPSSIIRSGIEDLPTGSEYLENWDCLPSSSIQLSLQSLKFNRGPDTLLDQIQYFIALKILWIQECNEMVDLPESLDNISSLQQLYLVCCRNLEHLPTKEAMQRLTQLKKLEAGEKFAFGKIIKLKTTVAKALQGVVI
nr:hypothetical protein CFP56_43601 [Quercus suber]